MLSFLSFSRRMSMSSKASNHLDRTMDASRSKILSSAVVEQISRESATVKKLRLRVDNENFSFKAGQWVDFVIPTVATVGGFSMCSSPMLLETSRVLDLAVKESPHPPAHWIHNQCKIGDKVLLKAGGDCFWDPNDSKYGKNTLLVAGGIGINPMISILQHIEDAKIKDKDHNFGKTILLYSASTRDELIFKENLDILADKNGSKDLWCKYFITKEDVGTNLVDSNIKGRRIKEEDISEAVNDLQDDQKGINCFLCGPPPMIKGMKDSMKNSGIPESNIHFEQWW